MTTPIREKTFHTNHHDPLWPQLFQEMRIVDSPRFTVYSPKSFSTCAIVLGFHTAIWNKTMEQITKSVLKHISTKGNDPTATRIFSAGHPTKYVDDIAAEAQATKQNLFRFQLLTGNEPDALQKCVERAREIVLESFTEPLLFTFQWKKKDFAEWEKSLTRSALTHLYSQLNMQQSAAPVSFSQTDFETFSVDPSKVSIDPKKMSCFAFALLLAGETQAKDLIFHEKSGDVLKLLQEWNWRPVDAPNAGDLVVYLSKTNEPIHVSYYPGEEGLVHSKLGCESDYSQLHEIFDVATLYSDRVVFFRKGTGFNLKELALEESTYQVKAKDKKGGSSTDSFISDYKLELEGSSSSGRNEKKKAKKSSAHSN